MRLRLDKLSTKDTHLNEFLSEQEVSPKKIYTYFEEDQLNEFICQCRDLAAKDNRKLTKFQLIENKESNS